MEKTPIQLLSEPLSKEDIEFRIGQSSAGKGFSLLAYKTARVDMRRLNEVFGLKWSNKYFYDDKGILACEISVYDSNTSQWISRTDVGTESQTETEKGSYSDAFKRAGFKWGIGAELYSFPFIWVNWDKWKTVNNKEYPDIQAREIELIEYEYSGGVKKLKLAYKGVVLYELSTKVITQTVEAKTVSNETLADIDKLIVSTGTDLSKVLDYFKVGSLTQLTTEQGVKLLMQLKAKK